MNKYCLALDLQEDDKKIQAYDDYHKKVWPEVKESLYNSGIRDMEIYRTANRLFMIIVTEPGFSLENKAAMDQANPKVQEWETLMSSFQKPLPWAKPGQKWLMMERVFKLKQEELNTDELSNH